MKLIDANDLPEPQSNYELAKECLDACYSSDTEKEFFIMTIDDEGTMAVYSSLDHPVAYMALDSAKEVVKTNFEEDFYL